jgi:large subunit ribosomal protein L17
MRHASGLNKLGRPSGHRTALYRNLVTSLIKHGKIETTLAKAQGLKKVADRVINLASKDSLHSRRQAYSYIFDKGAVHKLFSELGPKFKERTGGYTRVIRTSVRKGDAAQLAIVELTCNPEETTPAEAQAEAK